MNPQTRMFQANEVIFKEGVYERCMYHILKGSVSIYANYGADNEKLLTTLTAGQFFGEIGVSEALPRTATAIAAGEGAELMEITTENFADCFRDEPEKILALMRQMSGRLRALTADYLEARKAISEAVRTAKSGAAQSESLTEMLARLVQNALSPAFLNAEKYVEAEFMADKEHQEYVERSFRKNEIIFREGDEAFCIYDIRWGTVGIYANYGADDQKLLAELKPNDFFGEMGLLEHMPRSATAVALDANTQILMISEFMFHHFLEEQPAKVLMMMMHLSRRIRTLSRDYMDACRLAEIASKAEQPEAYWAGVPEDFSADEYAALEPWHYHRPYYRF